MATLWRTTNCDGVLRRSAPESDCLTLVIPSAEHVAAIVDGQHRLHGFEFASDERKDMQVLCAVYLDLPQPYQAYLFATINFNQRKVDRSLAYELFGFNLEEEEPATWSPDKTAVHLCRRLNTDPASPLFRHVRVAAENADQLFEHDGWTVSTAAVVDGTVESRAILAEIATNSINSRYQKGGERFWSRKGCITPSNTLLAEQRRRNIQGTLQLLRSCE